MTTIPLKKPLFALGIASALILAGCNSNSSSSGDNRATAAPRDTNNDTVEEGVAGPLDAIQTPLNDQVLNQLSAAVSGTPLEGTLDCIGQAVVVDLLDVVDALALSLQDAAAGGDPTAAFEAVTTNVQFALNELANDLPGALTALAGEDCNAAGGGFASGTNPLAGTPLEPLGASIGPVLAQISGEPGQDIDLQTLASLVHELSGAFASGTAQIPTEVQTAPILGGLLTTLQVALNDLDNTMQPLGRYQGEAAAAELETTLNHLLKNLLTEVVPINFIEAQAGQSGVISGPIGDGVDQATAAVADNLLDAALPPLTDAMDGPLAALLDPIENQLLPTILGPIADALSGTTADGPTGTQLDLILAQLTNALSGATGGSGGTGPTGTPLDLILGPLLGATSGGGGCPLAGTPLDPLCAVLDALPTP